MADFQISESQSTYSVSESSDSYIVTETVSDSLSDYQGDMAIWLSDDASSVNYTTKVWADKTGNTSGATVGQSNCIDFTNDTTLTLNSALVGSTVTELNGSSGDTTGVTVNGSGHIEFDVSEMTASEVWSVTLDSGEEFRFSTGIAPFIFCADNYGTLGGTEDTDWAWALSDDAEPLNMEYGFSKYAYCDTNITSLYYGTNPGNPHSAFQADRSWSVFWEGNFIGDVGCVMQLTTEDTWKLAVVVDRGTNQVRMMSRNVINMAADVDALILLMLLL